MEPWSLLNVNLIYCKNIKKGKKEKNKLMLLCNQMNNHIPPKKSLSLPSYALNSFVSFWSDNGCDLNFFKMRGSSLMYKS